MLAALGARFLADGGPSVPGGGGLRQLATADLSGLDPRLPRRRVRPRQRRRQPAHRPEGRRRGLRAAEGREPGRRGDAGRRRSRHYAEVVGRRRRADLRGPRRRGRGRRHRLRRAARPRREFRPGIEVMLDAGLRPALAGRRPGDHRRGLARRADPARQGPGGRRRRGACRRASRWSRSAAASCCRRAAARRGHPPPTP